MNRSLLTFFTRFFLQDFQRIFLLSDYKEELKLIENRVLGYVECKDNLDDTLEVLESIIFNTKVLDLKAINGDMTTHIILDEISAKEIGETLIAWANKEL